MKYKTYVDEKNIKCDYYQEGDFSFRRKLEIPFKNPQTKNKKAVFIMMNPSKATEKESDTTLDRILEHVKELDRYSEVIILNTISLYESKSEQLKEKIEDLGYSKFKEEQKINIDAIQNTIDELTNNDDIYLATGNPLSGIGGSSMIKLYKDILKNKSVFAFKSVRIDTTMDEKTTVEGFTFHPSRQPESFFEDTNRFKFVITGYGTKINRKNDANVD